MSISLLTQSIGIPTGEAGWTLLQRQSISSFSQFTSDPVLKGQIAYFEANVGKATTVDALLADPRLQDVAYTAYGLTAQIGANGLMKQVLTSNLSDPNSVANRLNDPAYRQIAAAFGYANASTPAVAAVPSSATVTLNGMYNGNFSSFSGTFGGVTLSGVDLSKCTTPQQVATALTSAFQKADNGATSITATLVGNTITLKDSAGRGTASGFAWTANPADTKAPTATTPVFGQTVTASSASVTVHGVSTGSHFSDFSGTFGGITLNDVDLSRCTTAQEVASALTAAFQTADGGQTSINVGLSGSNLTFTDAAGRGTAASFQWTPSNPGSGYPTTTAASNLVAGNVAVTATMVQGSAAVAATGGPNVVASNAAAVPAVASQASVALSGMYNGNNFASFSGSFGGVNLDDVDLSACKTPQQVANVLNSSFQRADNGSSNITVTLVGNTITFKDAAGRGAGGSFVWTPDGTATASAATNVVRGSVAVAASTGTNAAVAATASQATVDLNGLYGGNTFASFSGSFGGVSLSGVDLSGCKTYQQVANALNAAFQKADGGATSITAKLVGDNIQFTDAAGRGTAANFAWTASSADTAAPTASKALNLVQGNVAVAASGTATAAVAAIASTASVDLNGMYDGNNFSLFSGTFGGVTLSGVDLSKCTTPQQVANALNAAFQKADKGASNITATLVGNTINFKDASGRGTATNFAWTANAADTKAPTASTAANLVAGSTAVAASSGTTVTSANFVQTIVQKYMAAQFQSVVGNSSATLQNALYAKQTLPTITNWYSVIADTQLATVIETSLGLPSSFPEVDVDRQAAILGARMNIKDFQDPAKLAKLLNNYVAIGSAQEASSSSSAGGMAVQLLSSVVSGSRYSNSSAMSLLLNT